MQICQMQAMPQDLIAAAYRLASDGRNASSYQMLYYLCI
jgi:hypothetical protein